jgi:hypothetical protein
LGYNFGINKLFEKSTQKFLGGILKKENKKNTVDFINKKFGVLDYLNNNYIKIILNKDDLKFIKFETNEKNIDVEILVKLLISCDLKATKNSLNSNEQIPWIKIKKENRLFDLINKKEQTWNDIDSSKTVFLKSVSMKNRGVDSLHMFKSLFSHYLQILLYECSRIRGLHNIIMCKIINK